MFRLIDPVEVCGVWRAARLEEGSFRGGVGPWSRNEDSVAMGGPPKGPRGSSEPSTASSRVGWAPTFRGVRGLRPAGDLGAFDAEGVDDWSGAVAAVESDEHD